jgi:xanthine dehydrogenase accessory factor
VKLEILQELLKARGSKQPVVLVTELETGHQGLVYADSVQGYGVLSADVVEAARRALNQDRSATHESAQGDKLFLHVFNPPLRLIIVGAVHIAQALAPMAALAGYRVTIVDPRRSFASQQRFPDVRICEDWPDEAMESYRPDSRTAVVTLTHDPKLDDPALIAALASDAFYIGSLGSRRTHAARLQRLTDAGVSERALARLHGPVGLDIGAKSPAEIATSILAQITQVLHLGSSA